MFDFQKYPKLNSMDASVVDKAIEDIVQSYSSAELREMFHVRLLAVVEFCNFHKDGSRLDKLWDAMPLNMNAKGILTWLQTFTFWDVRKNKNGISKFLSRDDDTIAFKLDPIGYTMPFYAMGKVKKQKEDLAFDFDKKLDDLLSMGIKKSNDKNIQMSDFAKAELKHILEQRLAFKASWEVLQRASKPEESNQVESEASNQVESEASNLVELNAA